MIKFNYDISLDTVAILVAVIAAFYRFGKLENKLNIVYEWFEQQVINNNGRAEATAKHKAAASGK